MKKTEPTAPAAEPTAEPTAQAIITEAVSPVASVECHVYANRSDNPKAPAYRVEVLMPWPLVGQSLEFTVWRDREGRGFEVMAPRSRSGDLLRPLPVFAVDATGKRFPVRDTADAKGVNSHNAVKAAVLRAVAAHRENGATEHTIVL